MKRGSSGLCGVLAIDKPAGISSHDVVNRVRRITGERRVGHAGTLDPLATGLMLVGVGAATRLSNYLTGHDKSYRARLVFGVGTDTDDSEGRVTTLFSNSEPGEGLEVLEHHDANEVVRSLIGEVEQLPPAYSAIKKNGVTAYKAAREGKALELERRRITIYDARLVEEGTCSVDVADGEEGRFAAELPYWDIDLQVSKGTYIRSIARDLGQQLGCGAHLGALRRLSIADCSVEGACTIEQLEECKELGQEYPWCDPARLLGFPTHVLNAQELVDVSNGKMLSVDGAGGFVSCTSAGKLMAVYENKAGCLRPATVIPGGVVGVGA